MKLQQILAKQLNIANIGRLTSAIQTISMVKKQQAKKMHNKMIASFSILNKEINKLDYEKFTPNSKCLHIIFTADKKLCKNFIYLASNHVSSLEYNNDDEFMVFGKYAIDSLKHISNKIEIMNVTTSIEDSYTASEIALKYLMNSVDIKLHFYSIDDGKFISKSIFKGSPKLTECSESIFEATSKSHQETHNLYGLYIAYSIQMAAIETSMMENASRAVAMSQASDTCKSMQHQLKLDYNRLRQEKITLEMSEIIGGSNA
ncbi:F0F1 ATP synthase subunit gamma [Candidatus Cytomitobacter primus]|uniref:F0F1 ATP synthase subunit gamma n=1 Tax=Candidatus Cytomitobacter primus TaxID=2066024 RepID=A0A5C0UGE7_9PROT|nr:F0F1 ATP synthase subunit gamma [Candidatus Cytomitobacter primus]QEK38633.1 hypothetical protein FZC34_01785 [Candidatus Cytomitobacter primus]